MDSLVIGHFLLIGCSTDFLLTMKDSNDVNTLNLILLV